MPFISLIDRYETSVKKIYTPPVYAAPSSDTSGSALVIYENIKQQYDATQNWLYDTKKVYFNPSDVQYNWTKLKKGNVGTNTALLKAQSRTLPVTAALEDVKRLAKFQVSGKGLLFLAQQALLQTGNTFASSRIINPFFVVGNAVPFLHLNRSLIPISIPGIKLDATKELTGKLQQETIENLSPFLNNLVGKVSPKNSALKITQGLFSGGIKGVGKKLASPFKAAKQAISLGKNGSDEFGLMNLYKTNDFPLEFLPGDGVYIGRNAALGALYKFVVKRAVGLVDSTGNDGMFYNGGIRTVIKPEVQGTETPDYDADTLGNTGQQDKLNYLEVVNNNPIPYISRKPTSRRGQVGPSENGSNKKLPNNRLSDLYEALSKSRNEDDYIITRIRVGKFNMQFRSFIRDIKENVNSEFTEKNYIGRTERFISYTGAKRDVSFTLQLIAMHQDELMATHTRLNFLIGSLFPIDAVQGLLQPPIAFLTIGDLFSNQPGYFKSLSIDYPYSWEVRPSGINEGSLQLPMGANINANFTILEKGTSFHQSPFHGVMEKF